ncbi:MAG: type II toxin-antitoxin system VapC family toxin [Methylobacter sp.]|jgi:PIN domain nuclease of toxin-antitoxin system|nr:type II toxin-antitoxin system VapC family toxin [Methylobacter sp.]
MIVLDASALLAYLFEEKGHHIVAQYIESACISTVNLSEVAGRLIRDGIDPAPLIQQMECTSINVVPFTQTHALYAANFILQTQRYGLSLGDRACLGLAKEKQLAVLTADTVWSQLVDIEIIQIR